jgi:hypothetical protein
MRFFLCALLLFSPLPSLLLVLWVPYAVSPPPRGGGGGEGGGRGKGASPRDDAACNMHCSAELAAKQTGMDFAKLA